MLAIYAVIIIIGIGAVGWLLLQENRTKEKKSGASDLLMRLGLDNAKTPRQDSKTPPSESFPQKPPQIPIEPSTETAGPTDINLEPLPDTELQKKYEKLEKLLREKGEELEKKETVLNNELKAKREFNKIKDIFEKELKDSKDKSHKLQLEIAAANADRDNYKRRIEQLDEKLKNKEKEIKQKEQQIDDLIKRLQIFAKPSEPELSAKINESQERNFTQASAPVSEKTPSSDSAAQKVEPPQSAQQSELPPEIAPPPETIKTDIEKEQSSQVPPVPASRPEETHQPVVKPATSSETTPQSTIEVTAPESKENLQPTVEPPISIIKEIPQAPAASAVEPKELHPPATDPPASTLEKIPPTIELTSETEKKPSQESEPQSEKVIPEKSSEKPQMQSSSENKKKPSQGMPIRQPPRSK